MITLTILALFVVLVAAHLTGRRTDEPPARVEQLLGGRAAVAFVFLVTVAAVWWVWGSLTPAPVVHDELAYVLQAGIFAEGRWSLPSPALPLFFEQPHVLVEPALASKYFPGHSLLLTLGALLGWMPLVPLLLQGAAASLLFVLARRVSNGAVALLAWVLWLHMPMVLSFAPSYYSEATTVVCWLAGWYALLEWRTTRQRRWLLAVAACTGWCVLTRPLTGLAYAIPVGLVVVGDVVRERRWADLGRAVAVGAAVLAIIPLWSARTTGNWRVTPLQQYTRDYMPYDLPGFGLITTPPARTLNPQFVHLNEDYSPVHPHHVPSALPSILVTRAGWLASSLWGWSRCLLALFAAVGLLTLRGPTAFAVGSGVFLLLVYLSFGTPPTWTLYYYESSPAWAYLTAAGIAWCAAAVGRRRLLRGTDAFEWRSVRWSTAVATGALLLCLPASAAMRLVRRTQARQRVHLVEFARLRESLPDARAVLFVRYAPWHTPHETYVQNVARPDAARVLVVYDLGGAENARLLALMPDRTPYLFDEANSTVQPYSRALP